MIAKVRWRDRDFWLDATASGQGGRFDTTVQADFGLALVLDTTHAGLEKIPPRQASEPLNHVTETFDLRDGTRNTAKLTVKIGVSGRRSRRHAREDAFADGDGTRQGISGVLPQVLRRHPAGEATRVRRRPRREPPHHDGELTRSTRRSRKTPKASGNSRSKLTWSPSAPAYRSRPIALHHWRAAFRCTCTTRSSPIYPAPWNIDPAEVKIIDPAFDYHSTAEFADGRLLLSYKLRSTRDHVPMADLKKFLVNLDKTHDDAYFTLTDGDVAAAAAPTPTGPSLPMIATLMAGLGLGAGIAFLLTRLRWRLPKAEPDAPAGSGRLAGTADHRRVSLAVRARVQHREMVPGPWQRRAVSRPRRRTLDGCCCCSSVWLSATLVVSVMTVVLLLRRARTFPFAFIALQALGLSILVIDMASLLALGNSLDSTPYKEQPVAVPSVGGGAVDCLCARVAARARHFRESPACQAGNSGRASTAAPVGA